MGDLRGVASEMGGAAGLRRKLTILLTDPFMSRRTSMSPQPIETILKKYNDLDGAIVLCIHFETGVELSKRIVSIELKAFLQASASESGWRRIKISTVGRNMFCWYEASWDTNLVLNYPVKILRVNEYTVIDFDPLHSKASKAPAALSSCFLGGLQLKIEELAN